MPMLTPKELIKKVRRIQLQTRHTVNDLFAGQYHSTFKGRGMEFEDVREYMPGDDIRTIDWNVTARSGRPYIKKFTEERELTVMLLIDVSASNLFGTQSQLKRDLATEIAAVLAFSAIRNNDRIGLILFSDQVEKVIPAQKGTQHVLRIIRELLTFEPTGKKSRLIPALDYLNHICPRRVTSFLLSDFYFDDTPESMLKTTACRHDLISIKLADRGETALPSAGLITWQDAETGACSLIDTSSPLVRKALLLQQTERAKTLETLHRRNGIDLIQLYTDEPYEKAFRTFFANRAHRR
jgi:uncharacterized protein (DUF58 family)